MISCVFLRAPNHNALCKLHHRGQRTTYQNSCLLLDHHHPFPEEYSAESGIRNGAAVITMHLCNKKKPSTPLPNQSLTGFVIARRNSRTPCISRSRHPSDRNLHRSFFMMSAKSRNPIPSLVKCGSGICASRVPHLHLISVTPSHATLLPHPLEISFTILTDGIYIFLPFTT